MVSRNDRIDATSHFLWSALPLMPSDVSGHVPSRIAARRYPAGAFFISNYTKANLR